MKIIVGTAGSGKTTELVKIASEFSKSGKKVLLLSGENEFGHLSKRLIDYEANLKYIDIDFPQSFENIISFILNHSEDVLCIDDIQLGIVRTNVDRDRELELKLNIISNLEKLTGKEIIVSTQASIGDTRLKDKKLIQVDYKEFVQ